MIPTIISIADMILHSKDTGKTSQNPEIVIVIIENQNASPKFFIVLSGFPSSTTRMPIAPKIVETTKSITR